MNKEISRLTCDKCGKVLEVDKSCFGPRATGWISAYINGGERVSDAIELPASFDFCCEKCLAEFFMAKIFGAVDVTSSDRVSMIVFRRADPFKVEQIAKDFVFPGIIGVCLDKNASIEFLDEKEMNKLGWYKK